MNSDWKDESPTWCRKHQCQKTWMIQNAFCPQCEKETHGEKGEIKKYDPSANADEPDFDITIPDWNRVRWEAYYGTPVAIRSIAYGAELETELAGSRAKWTLKAVDMVNAGLVTETQLVPWHSALLTLLPLPK